MASIGRALPMYGTFDQALNAKKENDRLLPGPNRSSWRKRHVLGIVLGVCGFAVVSLLLSETNPIADGNLQHAFSHAIHQWSGVPNGLDIKAVHSVNASVYLPPSQKYDPVFLQQAIQPRLVFNVKDESAAAHATFIDSLHTDGWSKLWIRGTAAFGADENIPSAASYYERSLNSMFASGYLEGYLTAKRISEHYLNTYRSFFPGQEQPSPELRQYINENMLYLRSKVNENEENPEWNARAYWRTVGGILAQFDGLVAGYTAAVQDASNDQKLLQLSSFELYLLNLDGDLEDIIPASARLYRNETSRDVAISFSAQQQLYQRRAKTAENAAKLPYAEFIRGFRCSALVRILPDKSDVTWGHTTWDQFSAMVRIAKSYDIPIAGSLEKDESSLAARRKMTMSSSPGYLGSVDDFYIMDSGLAVTETTNGQVYDNLYDSVTPKSLPTWMRANLASTLASKGSEWATVFSLENSGTYNNQWMIIDTDKFERGKGFLAEGFTVLEQMPGRVVSQDLSQLINEKGYWASYNLPFFPEIYEKSGFLAAYKASNFSADWSYNDCPRAKIFARDADRVTTYEEMKRMIRYNKWEDDPLSAGHAGNAIASRFDLERSDRSFFGGIDAKISNLAQAKRMQFEAVNGPTTQQPVFRWSDHALSSVSREGQPDSFNFAFVTMGPL